MVGKVEYCTDCHGPSGQGYHGYLTMPRLAGQTPEYVDKQLRNFADRSRERNLFINMARVHGLSSTSYLARPAMAPPPRASAKFPAWRAFHMPT
jgi:cytochrome c553